MSVHQLERDKASALFVGIPRWLGLAETDAHVAPGHDRGLAMLAVFAPWPDARRCARALTLIDTEIRRATTAWSMREAHDQRDLESVLAALKEALYRYPSPHHTDGGAMHVTSSRAAPFAVLLEPQGPAAELLTTFPAAALTYVMSVFGQEMRVNHRWHAALTAADFASPDERLRVLADARAGTWRGKSRGSSDEEFDLHGRPGTFRAISPADDRAPVGAALYATEPGTDNGVFVSIELHERATSIGEFGDGWRAALAPRPS